MQPLLGLALSRVFLLQPLTVLTRQTRKAVCGINQSIFKYHVYGLNTDDEVHRTKNILGDGLAYCPQGGTELVLNKPAVDNIYQL